jgi:hypothetical protein
MNRKAMFSGLVAWAGCLPAVVFSAEPIEPLPYAVPAGLPDVAEALSPSAVHLDGWLGHRVEINAANRLLTVDTEPLLAGYRHKPGTHPWIGEHVGKWMHAAVLAWAYTGDPELRKKIDAVAADLIHSQEPDGYLGTYVPEQRFGLYKGADWDVWSHKYSLLGLLTYYQYTGDKAALSACRKAGDLLIATFPAKKSILDAGTHMGMAATSVLEPVVLLYRATGDERYLQFARYIVKAWDEPTGPKIIATLLAEKQVNKTANGKAYEMLSNLVGLCELARATGDRSLLEPVLNAWQDIVEKRLYLTGSASAGEHFPADFVLPNGVSSSICETCVTVTWIQLNLQLLRLTGEARFGDELERAFYNHLAAAQHPNGSDWCYYTALEGRKPYDKGITCCHSSGPRGMALAPQAAYLRGHDAAAGDVLLVDTLESSHATLKLGGQTVTVQQQSGFPYTGDSVLTLQLARPATFAVRVRVPAWASPLVLQANGTSLSSQGGWAALPAREWKEKDHITLKFTLGARVVLGTHNNAGRVAAMWGPFVLACDQQQNAGLPMFRTLELVDAQPALTLKTNQALSFDAKGVSRKGDAPATITLTTFADAGAGGGVYRVWLRAPGSPGMQSSSLLFDGEESYSRRGNVGGSINDGDPKTYVVTFNRKPAKEDWFAVTLAAPVTIGRVVFVHGESFHDGGWFDTSAGKPQVQVKHEKNGTWETVGVLSDYPATTATDGAKLRPGQAFTLCLSNPVSAIAVRVMGVPACGDNPQQAFASCAELQAMAK